MLALAVQCAMVASSGCTNDPPEPPDAGTDAGEDAGVADAGTKDAGADAGDPNFLCDLAAQDCDAGTSCLMHQLPSGAFGTACLAGGCDLVRQDCAPGEKCSYVSDGGVSVRACVPDGTANEGEPCTGTATSNSCRKGLLCVGQLLDDGGTGATCLRLCNTAGDCAMGQACFLTIEPPNSSERPLVCETPCDLFTQDCPPSQACYPGPTVPGCYAEGTVAVGGACSWSDECVRGAACLNQKCAALCVAPGGSCASGSCTEISVPGVPDAGACL